MVRCIGEAAAALELAHGVGTIHRDLKPANLFLHRDDDGRALVKVLDFGMVVDTAGPTDRLRDAELEQHALEQALEPGAVVTLTGTAGIGKTRLAQAVTETANERFVDGAWFVALPAADGDAPVLSAIAAALGLAPDPTRSAAEHLIGSLAPRRLLLVLDGAERAPAAAAVLANLRRACPGVSWLVTSRVPLGLAGERGQAVEPLDVPRAIALTAGEDAARPHRRARPRRHLSSLP